MKSIFFKKSNILCAKQSGCGFFSDWLTLEGVSRGEVLLSAEWREAVPVGDRDECEFESFILSVFVDSCRKLVRKYKIPHFEQSFNISFIFYSQYFVRASFMKLALSYGNTMDVLAYQ